VTPSKHTLEHGYRVKWDEEASAWRIQQLNGYVFSTLYWLQFASKAAAHAHVEIYGLPPTWKRVRVRGHVRAVAAA
jgi:hypothetical protein